MRKAIKILLALCLCLVFVKLEAQPFKSEIEAFLKSDSVSMPVKGQILFVGSSSFRKWADVQNYFPNHKIINRGFGGSTLIDVIRYEDQIIFPYAAKQIVIYCGENDIADNVSVNGKMVAERFKNLYWDIRKHYPNTPILFVSLKPSPSRWDMRNRMIDANKRIRKFLKKENHAKFVSVWQAMLDKNGMPIKEIFLEDNLHMNADGYSIWKKIIEPYLL